MQIFPCQMSSFLQTIVLTPAQVLRPRAPPPLQPPDTTVHTAVEGPEMTVTDQVWYMCLETLSIHIMFFLNLTLFVFILFFSTDIHTEAVQAALAKHKEEKMALPMPTKRRSAFVQSPIDTCTPPGELKVQTNGSSF